MPRIIAFIVFIFYMHTLNAQEQGILVRAILYKGDTIPSLATAPGRCKSQNPQPRPLPKVQPADGTPGI